MSLAPQPPAPDLSLPILTEPSRLIAFDSLASTNEEARRLASAGAEAWTFVWAREQTAGRGRRGNDWVSPPGNLYLSVVLRPQVDVATAAQIGFVVALALADAIEARTGLRAGLKWPNDLLVKGRKLSGILVESTAGASNRVEWLVVGTGVNVASHPAALPQSTDLAEQGADIAVPALIEAYAGTLQARVEQWLSKGFSTIRRDWLADAVGIGEAIRVKLGTAEEYGIFEDLDETGALVLVQGQARRLITSGDVFPAEPV